MQLKSQNVFDITKNISSDILSNGVFVLTPDNATCGPDIYKYVKDTGMIESILNAKQGTVM